MTNFPSFSTISAQSKSIVMLGQLDPHFIGNVEVFSPSLQEVHMFQNKRVFVVLSVIVLLALVLAGCSGSTSAQTGSTSSNFTGFGTVKQISYTDTVESTGQIEPQHLASLSFSTTGTVAQNKVQVGQSVNAGDILMTLTRPQLQQICSVPRMI